MHYTKLSYLLAVLVVVFVAACGGGNSGAEATTDEAASQAETPNTSPQASGDAIEITPLGNEMKYAQTEFTVTPGQQVHIVFRNTADSPAMSHNVVVLNTNDDAAVTRVGTAALAAGEAKAYIPEDPAILAHTPLAKPGETVEVTFTAPTEPGEYKYICTFPGHYMMMQGIMRVSGNAPA